MIEAEANQPLAGIAPRVGTGRAAVRTLQRLRRSSGLHPEWWVVPTAAAAWVFVITTPHPHAGHGAPAHGTAGLAAMTIAMMLPLIIAPMRKLARGTPWRRRHRAVAAFLAGYLAVWMLAMLLIDAAWRLSASRMGWTAAALAVVLAAAVWEIAAARQRRMGCDRPVPFVAHRWRANGACARFGMTAGGSCVVSCWALMAACVAFAHSLPVMVVLFGVQLIGRYRPAASPVFAVAAVLAVCLPAIASGMAGHHVM